MNDEEKINYALKLIELSHKTTKMNETLYYFSVIENILNGNKGKEEIKDILKESDNNNSINNK